MINQKCCACSSGTVASVLTRESGPPQVCCTCQNSNACWGLPLYNPIRSRDLGIEGLRPPQSAQDIARATGQGRRHRHHSGKHGCRDQRLEEATLDARPLGQSLDGLGGVIAARLQDSSNNIRISQRPKTVEEEEAERTLSLPPSREAAKRAFRNGFDFFKWRRSKNHYHGWSKRSGLWQQPSTEEHTTMGSPCNQRALRQPSSACCRMLTRTGRKETWRPTSTTRRTAPP